MVFRSFVHLHALCVFWVFCRTFLNVDARYTYGHTFNLGLFFDVVP